MKTVILLIITIVITAISSCQNPSLRENNEATDSSLYHLDSVFLSSIDNWDLEGKKFDLDGDKINDQIYFHHTGGAHCCYQISIELSSDNILRNFPFLMDGFYSKGVDFSLPEIFDIRDIDKDGLPEILMEIEIYHAAIDEVRKIPEEWQAMYGIKSNHIVIEYEKGQLIVRDN